MLLALYLLVGEEQGVPLGELRGTTQNDGLKEYIARGNFIYPPEGTMRRRTDLFAWSAGDAAWIRRRGRRANSSRARADVAGRFSTRPSGRAACRNRRDEVSGA